VNWKRQLFLFHRWTGIGLCIVIALWFVSGIVMMYVDFPQLTRPERLAGLPPLNFSTATLRPADAVARLVSFELSTAAANSDSEFNSQSAPLPRAIKLSMLLRRPLYVVYWQGIAQPRSVFADTGEVLSNIDAVTAQASASDFARRAGYETDVKPLYIEDKSVDQWTVSSVLNEHRPLHRVSLNDARGTDLYVSSTTGAVVRDTHRRERVLNYFGAVTHWIYPTFLRRHADAWTWTVDVLSGIGTVFAISGLWIGVLRWRRKRSPGKPAVPYRGLMRWHYFSGIVFGLMLFTWMASGLLSMNPGDLNPSRAPSLEQRMALSGATFDPVDFDPPAQVLPPDVVEAELIYYDAQPFFATTNRAGSRVLIAASDVPSRPPTRTRLLVLAQSLLPHASLVQSQVLAEYDSYYYSRRPENGDKLLPVLRVQFDDADKTWFHIDLATAQVLEKVTRTNRLFRWLYNGLHSWDIRWLRERRPLWDIGLIVFLIGGLVLTSIGSVIGYRRLRR